MEDPCVAMSAIDKITEDIQLAERSSYQTHRRAFSVNHDLHRNFVSYQRDKAAPVSRWCRYKEAFSADFVRYVIGRLDIKQGRIVDPFAGTGTALFTSAALGLNSIGIELMPNAMEIIEVRKSISSLNPREIALELDRFAHDRRWELDGPSIPFNHLVITRGAFPSEVEHQLGRFRHEVAQVSDPRLRRLLSFAAMCVLEDISYTSKDGQYLRWDSRAPERRARNTGFRKRAVLSFTSAICQKLRQISEDLQDPTVLSDHLTRSSPSGQISVIPGSALDVLPDMDSLSADAVITSPPYCNRYDYTRTYALELAMLGIGEDELKRLRQSMLSCTVENKEKSHLREREGQEFRRAVRAFERQDLLGLILSFLQVCRSANLLNNNGIVAMLNNYFKEMSLIIFQCARILKPGSPLIMVNDNVRYQGVHIPVDLILADIALEAGFEVEHIWLLPVGKGSSSQQTIAHGRETVRKCVYVWRMR